MGQFTDQFNQTVDGAQNPQANANLTAGVAANPDQAATNLQLGRRFGVHPDVAAAMQDDFKKRAAAEDAQVGLANAPIASSYVAADPVRAQVSHDDTSFMGSMESALSNYGQTVLKAIVYPIAALRQLSTNPQTGIDIAKGTPGALASGATSIVSGVLGAGKGIETAAQNFDVTAPLQRRLFGDTVENKLSGYFGRAATATAGEAQALAPNPTGDFITDQSLGVVQALPGVALALGGGMSARALGWSAEGASALGALSMGVPAGGNFYQKATDAGVSPGKAGLGALAIGGAMTAAGFSGELPFIKATDAGAPLLMRYVQSQIPEQLGMQGANLVDQFTNWAVLPENKDKTLGDFLHALPASAATTAIQVATLGAISNFGLGALERATGNADYQARLDAASAEQAKAHADGIKQILDLAASSKTRDRDPASFEQFMKAETEDGPLEHVYVDGRKLAQTLQDGGAEGADLAARLPSVQDQLGEAVATGGDVRIPTSELATALPGHALEQSVTADLRVDPLADSANDAKVKQDEAVDRVQKSFDSALETHVNDDTFQRSRDAVVQNFVNKLGDTGRFTRDVNQKYGQLLGDFYATQAQKLGISPEEMAARYPLDIRSQLGDESPEEQQTNQPKGDTLLNVGLARPDGQPDNTPEQVISTIEKHGGTVTESATHKSDTENTVVARLDKLLTPEQAHAVSEDLGQEAIAQHSAGAGELHGPGAEAWRPFSPDYFLKMDGTRLSDEELRTGAEPLVGLPKNAVGPMPEARAAAEDYATKAELPYSPPRDYVKVDKERAARIAQAFEEMKHDPSDPLVKASYDAMIAETLAQWEQIKSTGLKVEFINGEDPYGNPRNAILDVRENNHLWVYPTSEGFGSSDLDVSDNPLLATVPGETISGRAVQANDIFRIVHDYFGHIKEGVGFRADGEENAWRAHSAMYSPLARQAMTTETRGQNSWVNFGPHGETNRTAGPGETIYAPQKIGLLPEWVVNDGASDVRDNRLDQTSKQVVDAATQKLIDKVPGYAGVAPYLTPEERATVRAASAKKMTDLFESFPSAEEMASVAWSGRAKRGWYERSANALLDIFGANDAPRFAALLAALSPQTSVESNAINAVKTWVNWDQAGRPTDRQAIIEIMGKSVQGGKGVGSVLNAWINNGVRALSSADGNVTLSGPKVNSFMDNLVGVTDEVTNDAWMANYAAIDQGVLAGQDPGKTGVKGKSAGYKTMSALARKAAEIVSTRTGETWTPAEIQETVWSWAKTLYEARDRGDDGKTTTELLAAGGLTHNMIANTPDFATLFAQGVYRRVLEFGGYGDKLGNEGGDRGSDGPSGSEGSAAEAEGAGIGADAFQAHLDEAARRLETVRARRRGAAEPDAQQTLFQHPRTDIEREVSNAGIDASVVRRAANGTILVGVEPFYSNDFHLPRLSARAAELSERLGQQVSVVADTDPRLKGAEPVSHQEPPVNERGNIELQHFSSEANLTRTDPSRWGSNYNFLPRSERARLGTDLGRTYFGIATGEPGGYINEFGPGMHPYTAEVPASKLYDIMGDPDGMRLTGVGNYERAIKAAGYDGYWVKNGELGLVATMFNPVDVTPAPGLAQQRAAQQARGHLTFGNDVTKQVSTITLLKNADLSTFLHESGHFFLEVMSHMASQPDAPQSIKDDFAKTLKFMGTDAATWAGSDFEKKRDGHEKFARGFEAYLFEGKAPSEGMRSVFQHFKSWIISVYRNNIKNLNVKLNPDIRGVFDRLIASDEAIKAAEDEAGLMPAFPTKPGAMSDAEWADYQKLGDAAHAAAADSLSTASIRDMRFASRAKDAALKRLQDEVAEKRDAVRAEVAAETAAQPVYRATDFMRRGLLDGEKVDGPTKISLPELEAMYPDKAAYDVVRKALNGMVARENGMHPEQMAELFGFGSADEMIRNVIAAPKRDEVIDGETDSRMLERYGDITSPQALDRAASAAIHNEVRGRILATELREGQRALAAGHNNEKGNASIRVLSRAAKRYAEGAIARLKVRDVRPVQFEASERRAAAAAMKALSKGDNAAFVMEKRNQLLNFHLTREARDAQDYIQKTIDYFRKFAKAGTRDKIDRSYLDQIDGMLDRFDFRTGVTDKQLAARKSLSSWIESQRAMGLEPNIDPAMENEANRQSYKDMTMDELRGLRDSIKNIEHLGRLKDKLLKARDERELSAVVAEIRDSIVAKAFGKVREQPFGSKSWLDKAKDGVFTALTSLRKLGSLAREMDGNEAGPMWDHVIRALNDASVEKQGRLIDAVGKLQKLFADMGDRRPWVKEYEPAIGRSISHEDRLMMAMNWGNDLNRQRLLDGHKLTEDQVNATLAKLTKRDWDFVQGVWRHIDSHWPEIEAQALRIDGVAPEKQAGVQFPIRTADGHDMQIDGGYFPIKYDADKNGRTEALNDAEYAKAIMQGAFTRSTTRRGFLKERAEKVDRPLRLSFDVIYAHHNEVIHDLAYRETLLDVNRITDRLDPVIRQHYGPEVIRAFKKTYEDIAAGNMGARNAYDKGIAYLRSGTTTAGIGWNIWTGLFHLTGFANAAARVGPVTLAKGIGQFFGDAAKMQHTSDWVYEQSDYMKQRAVTHGKMLTELGNRYDPKGPIGSQIARIPGAQGAGELIHRSFHAFIDRALRITSVPTWAGAYNEAVDAGEAHDRAVALADQAVRDSHGDHDIQDTAEAMRSRGITSLFTSFMMWFSTAYNQMVESGKLAARNPNPGTIAKAASDFLLIAIAPAATLSLAHSLYNGEDWRKAGHKALGEVAGGLLGFFPYLRELSPVVASLVGGEKIRDYQGPAGTRFLQAATAFAKDAQQDGLDRKTMTDLNIMGGALFHYPAAQIQRSANGVMALADGKTKNPTAPFLGPPPKKD